MQGHREQIARTDQLVNKMKIERQTQYLVWNIEALVFSEIQMRQNSMQK
jgi:hypothetical protein